MRRQISCFLSYEEPDFKYTYGIKVAGTSGSRDEEPKERSRWVEGNDIQVWKCLRETSILNTIFSHTNRDSLYRKRHSCSGQKMVSDSLELELQALVSHLVRMLKWNSVLQRSSKHSWPPHRLSSLQLMFFTGSASSCTGLSPLFLYTYPVFRTDGLVQVLTWVTFHTVLPFSVEAGRPWSRMTVTFAVQSYAGVWPEQMPKARTCRFLTLIRQHCDFLQWVRIDVSVLQGSFLPSQTSLKGSLLAFHSTPSLTPNLPFNIY